MIRPALQGEAFLSDIRAAATIPDELHLWWLGQSGFLLQWNRRHLLLDPYLSDSLTDKYSGTDKPHVRMTERVIEPEKLDFIDLVTSSHAHTDHLDAETLRPLLQANPELMLLAPAAVRDTAVERIGGQTDRLYTIDAGEQFERGGTSLTAIPSAHESIAADGLGRHPYLGYIVQMGRFTVYHSGDTVMHPVIIELLNKWQIDVALLPINGALLERRVAGNLSGREAAAFAQAVGARIAIPCHYEMFEFNTASPGEFVEECELLNVNYAVLRCGQRWSSADLPLRGPNSPPE